MRPEESRSRILGAVIAGGQSRRFGSDKALAVLHGRTLLDHVLAAIGRECAAVVICGRKVDDLTCLRDRPRSGMGPLGGLAAALDYAEGHGFDGVLTSACDTPLFPADLFARLVGPGPAIVKGQPLFGYWPTSLRPTLDIFLAEPGKHSLHGWADRVSARVVNFGDAHPNINTAADLDALKVACFAE